MQGCGSFQVMAKTYKSYLPEQDLLLPPSLREWLPENHLVYCVSDVVDQLDLSAIEALYEEEDRGQPPYHPRMMTKILVYGYCAGDTVVGLDLPLHITLRSQRGPTDP